MENLIVAALFFLGTHLGIASRPLRDQLHAAIGATGYRILYSVIALVALVWLVRAYSAAPFVELWVPGAGMRHLAVALMPLALLAVVCSLVQPNPTAIGQRPDADAHEPATGFLRITRHPMMWGITLWAVLHVLSNGDAASVVTFGSLAALALLGSMQIDRRRGDSAEAGWGVFLQRTSHVPFAAIIAGQQSFRPAEIGLKPVIITIVVYLGLLFGHASLFGVSPLTGMAPG